MIERYTLPEIGGIWEDAAQHPQQAAAVALRHLGDSFLVFDIAAL